MSEHFSDTEYVHAIENWLEYGQQEYGKSQQGYFSGGGWAARVLRSLKERLLIEIHNKQVANNEVAKEALRIEFTRILSSYDKKLGLKVIRDLSDKLVAAALQEQP
jgi:hypothetical protein